MGNLSKLARHVSTESSLALEKIVPLALITLSADGWNVLKDSRNTEMRSMALELLREVDGLLLQEAHVYYSDYLEVQEWAATHSLVLFTDFDPQDGPPSGGG